jgi:hypothetical protein
VVGGVKIRWKKAENASVKTRDEIRHANASTTRMGLAKEMKEIWESLAAPDEFEKALLANRPAAEALMNKIQESMAVSLENPTLTPRSPKERPGDELKRLQMSPRKVALYRKNGLGGSLLPLPSSYHQIERAYMPPDRKVPVASWSCFKLHHASLKP